MITKKLNFLGTSLLFLIAFFSFSPIELVAQSNNDVESKGFQIVPTNCVGGQSTGQTKDLGGCGWEDLVTLINTIINFLVYISASLAAIAFAYAGFLYMTAFGQSGKIEQAHGIFTKTLTGIFFVLCGYLLVALILKSLGVDANFSLITF